MSQPPMSKDEIEAFLVYKKSQRIYVVLMKDDRGKLTLLVDPGTRLPYKNENKKVADFMAAKCNGEARTWQDAWDLLLKETPSLEKDLVTRATHRAHNDHN